MNISLQPPPKFELAPYKSLENDELNDRIQQAKATLGESLLILGHHYQQDEVVAHADLRGDSYQLSEMAASNSSCRTALRCSRR